MYNSYFVHTCLLLKGLHTIATFGQMPCDPTSYLNLLIYLVLSVLNFSLENICLWLQRNLSPEWGKWMEDNIRTQVMKQAWNSQCWVGCIRELSNYSRTHGLFYPHCCFLAPPTKVNSKPRSSRVAFLMFFLSCCMHLSFTLKCLFRAVSLNMVHPCSLFLVWFCFFKLVWSFWP